MMDQETIIKGLEVERECVSRDCDRDCGKCDLAQDRDWLLSVYDGALELLKEQPEIVRCEDCIFRDPRDGMCEHVQQMRDPDWYCADGERRYDDG